MDEDRRIVEKGSKEVGRKDDDDDGGDQEENDRFEKDKRSRRRILREDRGGRVEARRGEASGVISGSGRETTTL